MRTYCPFTAKLSPDINIVENLPSSFTRTVSFQIETLSGSTIPNEIESSSEF